MITKGGQGGSSSWRDQKEGTLLRFREVQHSHMSINIIRTCPKAKFFSSPLTPKSTQNDENLEPSISSAAGQRSIAYMSVKVACGWNSCSDFNGDR